MPGLALHAVDVDPAAVRCARRNLVDGQVHEGDLDAPLPAALRGRVDVVVANAPYVPTDAIALMPPEARDHEPGSRSTAAWKGWTSSGAWPAPPPRWLAPGGSLLIETSVRQAPLTAAAVAAAGLVVRIERDDELDGTAVVGACRDSPFAEHVVAGTSRCPTASHCSSSGFRRSRPRTSARVRRRDPAQVHATLIGLEHAPDPFDPGPSRRTCTPSWRRP